MDVIFRLLIVSGLVTLSEQRRLPWPGNSTDTPADTPADTPSANRPGGPLMFRPDGSFHISIFNDMHMGENAWDSWGAQQDINTVQVISGVVDAEQPDLVVLNGDLITGENAYLENATAYLDELVAPLVSRGLRWATTYGNHDCDFNLSSAAMLEREARWPQNSLTRSMVGNEDGVGGEDVGVSNYYLPVYDGGCDELECAPALLLWFFDSRGGREFQDPGGTARPGWVHERVVDWWRMTSAEMNGRYGRVIPSLGFVHIPPYVSAALQRSGVDKHRQPGINDDVPLAHQGQGVCADGPRNESGRNASGGKCDYGGQDGAFMAAVAGTEGLLALFSGHDHGVSWCYRWEGAVEGVEVLGTGTSLCFGQRTGYGGYGNWVRGGRQVRVELGEVNGAKRNGIDGVDGDGIGWEADTWIRLETGRVVGRVRLNATYGLDGYAVVEDEMTHCRTCNYSVVTPRGRRRKT